MEQICTVRLQLKARYLPLFIGILLLFQLLAPYKGWVILLVGLGGAWLLSYLWARSLAHGLELTREFAAALGLRLRALARDRRWRAVLDSTPGEIRWLANLCTRALYSLHRPNESEQKQAVKTWSRLRRRLWLARLLTELPW